jgi:fido (protein-threonine AMPylation protein)
LLEVCKYWIDNKTFNPDEIAMRFSHRLVKIHVCPNGNGRHSRLIADILIASVFNKPIFTWGNSDLSKNNDIRNEYLEAKYTADRGDIQPLVSFSRKKLTKPNMHKTD